MVSFINIKHCAINYILITSITYLLILENDKCFLLMAIFIVDFNSECMKGKRVYEELS